jgi:hypothetical protein
VQVATGVAGFLIGDRFVTRQDGAFAVNDEQRAASLIRAGLVEGCPPPQAMAAVEVLDALFPGPRAAEKAIRKR